MRFRLTRGLLLFLGRDSGEGWDQVFMLGLVLALLPLALAADGASDFARWLAVRGAVSRRYLICPRGHRQSSWGRWTCGVCSWSWDGNGLICPSCGSASALRCVCGVAIPNPLAEDSP